MTFFSPVGRWTENFYRVLDSLDGEEGDSIRAVEMDVFHSKYKDHDSWTGSAEENRAADSKVANLIRSSLKNRDKNVKSPRK